jgi:hypothetical protein
LILERSAVLGVNQQEVYETAIIEFEESPFIESFQTQTSMKSAQSRRQVANRPVDPTLQTIGTFLIPPESGLTMNVNNPQNFVLHKENLQDPAVGTVGFLVLGLPRMASLLCRSTNINTDGTFAVAAPPFAQLWTLNFSLTRRRVRKLFGGLYVLMTHKTQFLYTRVLQWVIEYADGLNPPIPIAWVRTMGDFERAIINAFGTVF